MRSIGARLAFWYALCAALTVALLFMAGYQLLGNRLTHGLDQLNEAEFRQLKAHLGTDYQNLTSAEMDRRIRETSESASVLYYISISDPKSDVRFRSHNLGARDIPDIKGLRAYHTSIPGIGPVRADEFLLPPFDVTLATSSQAMHDGLREYARISAALFAVMLLASIAIGLVLSRILLAPMRAIRETANRIGSDNLSERILVGDVKDELSGLGHLLNAMFDRLEGAFVQIRRFSDEASHELKTPLSLIRLHAEDMLRKGDLNEADQESVSVLLEELARLNQIIDELLFLSRAEAKAITFRTRLQDPTGFLERFSQDAQALCEHAGLRFEWRHQGIGAADFEEKWIRQVLLNVLTNAINASPVNGRIVLDSELREGLWRVSIEDEGPGLTSDQRERIFERFVRLRAGEAAERGSGLGLTISRSIVEQHGGTINATAASAAHGLKVTFDIPAAEASGAPRALRAAA
ncbi:MAG TPA: ATP-binding protein [Caulobacteraceae bacterium]|jgi:two-component system heavy metal sensor histidine kinase CusS|nr:ATP-binding protein [Caulobacteraceae bacterium]